MVWPTANITTANVDSGTDFPRLARVQIKDAIDAVNNIKNEFGNVYLPAPGQNQYLVYTGTAWLAGNLPVQTGFSTGSAMISTVNGGQVGVTQTFDTESVEYTVISAGGTGITTTGTDSNITVPAGTYIWHVSGLAVHESSTQDDGKIQLWNRTANVELAVTQGVQTGSKSGPIYFSAIQGHMASFTLSSTSNLQPRYASTGTGTIDISQLTFIFTRIS